MLRILILWLTTEVVSMSLHVSPDVLFPHAEISVADGVAEREFYLPNPICAEL